MFKISISNSTANKKLKTKFKKYYASLEKVPFAQLPWQPNSQGLTAFREPLKNDVMRGNGPAEPERRRRGEVDEAGRVFQRFPSMPDGLTTLCVVGLGGSSLGTKAVLHALPTKTQTFFLDNLDPEFVFATLRKMPLKKTFFIIVSKSGETLEALTLAKLLLKKIRRSKSFCIITDDKSSTLARLAKQRGIQRYASPRNVPGRFSLFSSVCLLPLQCAGVPVEKLCAGARSVSWQKAYAAACALWNEYRKGKTISVGFLYAEALKSFGEWYVQLVSESIGKTPHIGITPIVAIGAKDQHSQLQLFLDGPDDKTYLFVKPIKARNSSALKAIQNIFDAEYKGVVNALKQQKKPVIEINFDAISPHALGKLFFFCELLVGFLGQLFEINFQNQPGVELSKKITKKMLS